MPRILIADDLPDNRYLLEVLLRGNGYEVVSVDNGSAAIEALRASGVDLIISDILMPVMDGFALCRACKEDSSLCETPFIFYTATYTEPQDEQFALSLGADRFLIKPQEPETLLEILRSVLREGKESRPHLPLGPEMEFFRQHNAVLFKKLEDKLVELEREVNQRKKAEDALTALNADLEARIQARTAELEALNAELEAFAYTVSHDLKSPLQAIVSSGELLAESCSGLMEPKHQRMLQLVAQEGRRMGQLINDLLAFSRMGKLALQPEPLDMPRLAQLAFQETSARHQPAKPVVCQCLPCPSASGDPALIHQVLINLFSNAIKYSQPVEQPSIAFGGKVDGGCVTCWVKDNGVGFDMKQASHLFEAFHRLPGHAAFEGTGAGLAIVRRIIQRHGGKVWAESAVGVGTTIFFTLPAVSSVPPAT